MKGKPKGGPTRTKDYIHDVERWTGHAKTWLEANQPAQAMVALNLAKGALARAMAYLETGEEQTDGLGNRPTPRRA